MNQKRERLEIIYDILRAIQEKNGKIRPTHILYKSNLSHTMMEDYLEELKGKGFVEEQGGSRRKTYSLTTKGFEFLSQYRLVTEFVDSFGLK